MMLEWLFFLLPISALSGWVVARNHYKKRLNSSENSVSSEYFEGLNYILNEQPDKAIDVFIRLLEVNSETVETHLALANLFRRRGETDRAIRIHQNLIARPTLNFQQKTHALVELGLDYMNAGVLDRAEQLFLELQQQSSPPPQAAQQLLRIYQQEKNWGKAIEMAKLLPSLHMPNISMLIAQFYCELAQSKLKSAPNTAAHLLKKAHAYDRNCVRANLLEADIYISSEQYPKALKILQQIEHQNYHYITEALPKLFNCYQKLVNLAGFESWLKQLLERHPSMTSAKLILAEIIKQQHGSQLAHDYLYQQLQDQGSLHVLNKLLTLNANSHRNLMPLLKKITTTLIQQGNHYTCHQCGFSGKTMHWQCPSCGQWQTIQPNEIHLDDVNILETLNE